MSVLSAHPVLSSRFPQKKNMIFQPLDRRRQTNIQKSRTPAAGGDCRPFWKIKKRTRCIRFFPGVVRRRRPLCLHCLFQSTKGVSLAAIIRYRTAYGNKGFSKDKPSACFDTALIFPECRKPLLCVRCSPGCTVLHPLSCGMPAKRQYPLSPSTFSRTFRYYRFRNADAVLDKKKEAGSF